MAAKAASPAQGAMPKAKRRRPAEGAAEGYRDRWAAKRPRTSFKGCLVDICCACEKPAGAEGAPGACQQPGCIQAALSESCGHLPLPCAMAVPGACLLLLAGGMPS